MNSNNEKTDQIELLKNVIHSTNNALLALSQLEQNFMKGRFKEGIKPYEIMINTLIGQRIWSSNKSNDLVNNNFKKIASIAQNIINILQPYIYNLEKLNSIGDELILDTGNGKVKIESISGKEGEVINNDTDKIIQIVKNNPKYQVTFSKLKSELGWNRKKLDKLLSDMEKTEIINISVFNSRKIISIGK